MGKLLKEAERVKLILSANSECFAQIENLLEEIDYKLPLNRDKLIELGGWVEDFLYFFLQWRILKLLSNGGFYFWFYCKKKIYSGGFLNFQMEDFIFDFTSLG